MPPLTHRLACKIEQDQTGAWNKVTVKLPNSSYTLTEVEYTNNTLSVLFEFSDNTTFQPINHAFLLSLFNIDANAIGENDTVLVAGIEDSAGSNDRSSAKQNISSWCETSSYKTDFILADQLDAQEKRKFKCPTYCGF